MGNVATMVTSCCDARSSETLPGKSRYEEADSEAGMCGMEARTPMRVGKAPRNVAFQGEGGAWQPDAEPDANHKDDSSYGPGLMAVQT